MNVEVSRKEDRVEDIEDEFWGEEGGRSGVVVERWGQAKRNRSSSTRSKGPRSPTQQPSSEDGSVCSNLQDNKARRTDLIEYVDAGGWGTGEALKPAVEASSPDGKPAPPSNG